MPDQTPAVGMDRKLAAIFSTDVAGYSRLMGDDEEATIRTLTAYRAVVSALIQHYRGRVVDAPGDNLLAEFASVVDAVRCAVAMQQVLTAKNAEVMEHRRMQFRIGINLGDVIVEGERLYGDGVNIAARLESLALPGGICISGTVYDQVETKVALPYEDLGQQAVKNIAKPVRVYRIQVPAEASPSAKQAKRLGARDQCVPLLSPPAQEGQQERSTLVNGQETRGGRFRFPLVQRRTVLCLFVIAVVFISALSLLKAFAVRNTAADLAGTGAPPGQNQPSAPILSSPSPFPKPELHRSFETGVAHGQRPISLLDKSRRPVGFYGASHALVVGISRYTGGWPSLPGVKRDVKAIVPVLEHQGFHVVVVMDPTLAELEGAYHEFIAKYGLTPDNRLLFYYAGSGYTIKPAYALANQDDWMGYLVARDAPLFTDDPEEFRRHALSMERFASMAREIEAKHALFVFDSCFSGAIAFSLGQPFLEKTTSEVTQLTTQPVRQFISAGATDQEVPDESVFRQLFIKAVEGDPEADRNSDGYVTGSELGQFLQEQITALSGGKQTPQYGKMADARLNRGDFVFTPSLSVPAPSIAALPSDW